MFFVIILVCCFVIQRIYGTNTHFQITRVDSALRRANSCDFFSFSSSQAFCGLNKRVVQSKEWMTGLRSATIGIEYSLKPNQEKKCNTQKYSCTRFFVLQSLLNHLKTGKTVSLFLHDDNNKHCGCVKQLIIRFLRCYHSTGTRESWIKTGSFLCKESQY